MREKLRTVSDKLFTSAGYATILLTLVILAVILIPMYRRGADAVWFTSTIEFHKMQAELFGHSDPSLQEKVEKTKIAREKIYAKVSRFLEGLNADDLDGKIKEAEREYRDHLRLTLANSNDAEALIREKRDVSKELRDELRDTLECEDLDVVKSRLDAIFTKENAELFRSPGLSKWEPLARLYLEVTSRIPTEKREYYVAQAAELQELIHRLYGPAPGEKRSPSPELRFGATRMDQVEEILDEIAFAQVMVASGPGKPLIAKKIARKEIFTGTPVVEVLDVIPATIDATMQPQSEFYWRFFLDDSTPGHYFGGIGPEILGTISITLLAMLIAIPLGVISAFYLVETAKDGLVTQALRVAINSLAGVPSIVYGLFGLAFFILYLFPVFGLQPRECILAASLTLAMMALPVVISTSEEAIRSVPHTYREASLGLGASRLRTCLLVVLPAALPGIITGIILSLSRIAGETAPILFTGAVAVGAIPHSILQPTRTLSYGSYDMAVGDRIASQVPHNQFGMVVTLITLVLLFNAVAIVLRAKIRKGN